MSDIVGDRPVQLSPMTVGWSARTEMDLVRDRLARLSSGHDGELFVFRAPRTAAFSRRDALLPGYREAERAMAALRFRPVIRPVGGHLAVYDEGSLVVHLAVPHPDPRSHVQARFVVLGEAIASALRGLGVNARVGPVPGEYCDGKFSVNDSGRAKLAGTGQRIVAGGYLFSAVVMVQASEAIRQALSSAYALLGLDFRPESVGAVADSLPGVTLDVVRDALLAELARVVPVVDPADAYDHPAAVAAAL